MIDSGPGAEGQFRASINYAFLATKLAAAPPNVPEVEVKPEDEFRQQVMMTEDKEVPQVTPKTP
jgi:hypothetical protein